MPGPPRTARATPLCPHAHRPRQEPVPDGRPLALAAAAHQGDGDGVFGSGFEDVACCYLHLVDGHGKLHRRHTATSKRCLQKATGRRGEGWFFFGGGRKPTGLGGLRTVSPAAIAQARWPVLLSQEEMLSDDRYWPVSGISHLNGCGHGVITQAVVTVGWPQAHPASPGPSLSPAVSLSMPPSPIHRLLKECCGAVVAGPAGTSQRKAAEQLTLETTSRHVKDEKSIKKHRRGFTEEKSRLSNSIKHLRRNNCCGESSGWLSILTFRNIFNAVSR